MDIAKIVEEMRGKTLADLGDSIPDEVRNKTPEQLQTLVKQLDAHLKAIHQEDTGELRDLSAAEEEAFKYGLKVREVAIAKIEEHRALSEVFSRRPASVKAVYANLSRGTSDEAALRLTDAEARDAALHKLDEHRSTAHLRSEQRDEVERVVRRNADLARRVLVTETDAYRSAFIKVTTRPDGIAYLNEEERDALRAWDEYRAMSTTGSSGADGGYALPVFIDPSIIMTAQGSGNPFLQLCDQVDVNTNKWKGVSSAGVTWSFTAEANVSSDNSPKIAQPEIDIFTARGTIVFSLELGQDYPSFASEMQKLLMEGYDELLVQKFTTGNGTTEPAGVLTVLSASASNRVRIETSGSAFGTNDPYAVVAAVPQRFRRNASWLMSVDVNNKIRQLGESNVFHAYSENLTAEWADRILGKTAYEDAYMPDTTTSTSATIGLAVVGDMRAGYKIARRAGMSVELVPHVPGTTGLPTGQRAWFAWSRIGANVVNTAALRLLVNT